LETANVRDSNGNTLVDGDSVTLIKSLKVKGSTTTLKQGITIKKIRLTDSDEEVDCKVDGMSVVLKTCFLKKK
jgi:protein PhnA